MAPVTLKVVLFYTMTVITLIHFSEALGVDYRQEKYEAPEAEERTFKVIKKAKHDKITGKKNWLLSLFAKSPATEPPIIHTLAPFEQYPIWKIHKYKGIELHPVQVVDVPPSFDYSIQPGVLQQYAPPLTQPVRMPHTDYGVPVADGLSNDGSHQFTSPLGSSDPLKVIEDPGKFITNGEHLNIDEVQFIHGQKIRNLIGLLKSHKGLFRKLKNLKSWKLGQNHEQVLVPNANLYPTGYIVGLPQLPEVSEIPIKGLEDINIQVPELPPINIPTFPVDISTGPYVRVKFGNPAQTVYQYAVPQDSTDPQYSSINSYNEHVPAPYYGAPPLYDSYGTPLPPDAYSSAPSEPVPSYALSGETEIAQQHETLQTQVLAAQNASTLTIQDAAESALNSKLQDQEDPAPILNYNEAERKGGLSEENTSVNEDQQ